MEALDLSESVFTHPELTVDDVVIAAFDTDRLTCPDGSSSRFYVVYPANAEAPTPVAVVMHSGAFDYLVSGTITDAGRETYHLEDRLNRDWSIRKVWNFL